jgi:hypothetical protein
VKSGEEQRREGEENELNFRQKTELGKNGK